MRKTLLSLLLLFFVCISKSQQKLPAFNNIPQGPVTAEFTRYGDIPVDLSTGVTNISIPIYTLNENGLNVPISISYHASGIKVTDIASFVGLGWTLNAGGGISRTVLGYKDESVDYGFKQRPPWVTWQSFLDTAYAREARNQHAWFYELYHTYLLNNHDNYSDRFYYNLGNGESGVFRRDFATNEFKTIPYKPIKIRFILPTPTNNLKLEITTADGTRYIFNNDPSMFSDYWNPEKIINSTNTDSIIIHSHFESVAVDGYSNTQEFGSYRNTPLTKTEAEIYERSEGPCFNQLLINERDWARSAMDIPSMQEDKIVLIDSIVSANSSVRFTYAQDRQDHLFFAFSGSRLVGIQVVSKQSGQVIKNFNFSHSYLGATITDKRLLLAGVQAGANGEEKYEFKYNLEPLPAYHNNLTNPFYQQDFWGYKNAISKRSLLFADFAPDGNNDLFPDETRAQAGILKEIRYPTGGKTVFEYESNRVSPEFYGNGFTPAIIPSDGKVGGLRTKRISSYAYEGAEPVVKSYEYVCDLEPSYGKLDFEQFAYNQECFNFFDPYVAGCGLAAMRWSSGISRKNICNSVPFGKYIGGPQAPVYYNKVTEYIGNEAKNSGKTVYHFRKANDEARYEESTPFPIEPRFTSPWHWDGGSYIPPLLKKEEYKYESGQYKLVRKTETSYTSVQHDPFITGLNLATKLQFSDLSPVATPTGAFDFYINTTFPQGYYFFETVSYSNDFAFPAPNLPWQTSVYDYVDNNNYVKTYTEYAYNQYGLQISANSTTSKGELLKTKTSYPVDYPLQAPYNTMVERNIIEPVIEQSTSKVISGNDEHLLQSMKTNYNYWDVSSQTWSPTVSNQILPQTVEVKRGDNNPETRIRYFSYDQKGNPTYVAKENDTRQLYLWDYNKTFPVAQVMNVSEDDKKYVVYNSFEAVTSWPVGGGNIVDDNAAPTGKKCLSLFGMNNLQYSINSNKSYILSYWYKEGSSFSVAANSDILANPAAKNGWVFMKRRISETSNVIISGSGYIDEIRLYPETAQMITFAYEPLVGVTAQCDANDRITYYTYDASGRLSLVKDDNGNILKKICYNFHGQPDACGENANPKWQITGATRCKPCPQNPVYFTNITQLEERDNNVNSETYGSTRWRDTGIISGLGACALLGDWQLTGQLRCRQLGGQLTGEQEREWKDMNPCSSTAGNIGWEIYGTNTTACPVPAVFQSLDVSGNYYSQNCGPQQMAKPYYVSMPQGSYTSSINIQDATNKAVAEAQRRANQNGECVTIYVKSRAVLKTDPSEAQQYSDHYFYFYADAAGNIPMALPNNLTINYIRHTWWTENGNFAYDEGFDNRTFPANAGNTKDYIYDLETTFCPHEWCWHQEVIIQPGNYVIIP